MMATTSSLISARAMAVSNPYPFLDGNSKSLCLAHEAGDQAKLIAGSNGTLLNDSNTTVTVHCPIVKTTSGPNIWQGDAILSVTVPVIPNGGTVTCELDVYSTNISSAQNQNWIEQWQDSASATSSITVGPPPGWDWAKTGYWNGGDSPTWFYADLGCTLSPHASLGAPASPAVSQYTVVEDGTTQSFRIYPPSQCRENTGANLNHNWSYHWDLNNGNGGYIYGNQDQAGPLKFDCPVPNGADIQMALGPAIGNNAYNTMGCRLDNPDLSGTNMTWPTSSNIDSAWPPAIIPLVGQSDISIPTTGSNHILFCGYKLSGNGDASIVSYRASL
jgi:hypothetical protein